MKNKFLWASLLLVVTLIGVSSYSANALTVQRPVAQLPQESTSFEYAQLTLETDGLYTWSPSGTNVVPQTKTLRVLYGRLGGNQRPSFVNLLGQIGADRWELKTIDNSVWTFKRTH